MDWTEIVLPLLMTAAECAARLGGSAGQEFSRSVKRLLEDSGFPSFRRAARDIGAEAARRLPRRRG